jgi:RNA recognition motif-containing protein
LENRRACRLVVFLSIKRGDNSMEKKLYVGNLAFQTTEDDLRGLFAQAGAVASVTIIKDRDTGRSRGFGFVEMETQADAEKAVTMFNSTMLHNRALKVNIARPLEDRGSRERGGFRRDTRGGGGRRR